MDSLNELLNRVIKTIDNEEFIDKAAREHAESFKDFTDIEGVVIRGHIVIEKALIKSIKNIVYKESEFKPDKFSFSQKLTIARMYDIAGLFEKEINVLNKLRNQIAHSLEFDEKYIDLIIESVANKNKEREYLAGEKVENLKHAISFICGVIMIDGYYAQIGNTLNGLNFLKKINE